jgi:hypothetical protein
MQVKFLGLRDLPYRRKNIVVFLPRVRIETYGVCKKTGLGRGFFVWGREVELDREGWEVIMLQSTYKCTIHWMDQKQRVIKV